MMHPRAIWSLDFRQRPLRPIRLGHRPPFSELGDHPNNTVFHRAAFGML